MAHLQNRKIVIKKFDTEDEAEAFVESLWVNNCASTYEGQKIALTSIEDLNSGYRRTRGTAERKFAVKIELD